MIISTYETNVFLQLFFVTIIHKKHAKQNEIFTVMINLLLVEIDIKDNKFLDLKELQEVWFVLSWKQTPQTFQLDATSCCPAAEFGGALSQL